MDNIFYKKLIEDTGYLQLQLNTANKKIKQLKKQLNEMESPNIAGIEASQEISKEIPFVSNKYSTESTPRTKRSQKKPPRTRQFDTFGNEIPQIGAPVDPYEGATTPEEQYLIYQRMLQQWLARYLQLYGWTPWLEHWIARALGQIGRTGEVGLNFLSIFRQRLWDEFMNNPGLETFPGIYGVNWNWDPILQKWIWMGGGNAPPSPDEWIDQNPKPQAPPGWVDGGQGGGGGGGENNPNNNPLIDTDGTPWLLRKPNQNQNTL